MRTNSSKLKNWSLIVSVGVFVVSIVTGLVAGGFLRSSGDTEAASANITVSDNDQVITQDQSTSTQTITKTSTVTIKDSSATAGYTLSARLSQNTMPNSTVTIGSVSSSTCTPSSPCTLTTTAQNILNTTSNTATGAAGDTTTWTVRMTVPANVTLGNYLLDIEYSETAIPLGMIDPSNSTTLFSQSDCSALPSGTTKNLTDTRDNKIYKVKKMIDDRCWMIDNLAFQLNNASAPTYSPAAALISGNTTGVNTQAQYIANTSAYNTAAGQTTYLYNWCAALGDTSGNCSASVNAPQYSTVLSGVTTAGTNTSQPDVTGICPAPFRLPKGGGGATSSNAATTANEFAKLDIAMGGTGAGRVSANTYPLFTGTATTNTNWSGVLSGHYNSGMGSQGSSGYWWSSTADSSASAYDLTLYSGSSDVYPANYHYKRYGYAVRCVL